MENNINKPVSDILSKGLNLATQDDLKTVWNATSDFLKAVGETIPTLLEYKFQLDNEGKGVSNKVVCGKHDINHREAIAFLRSVGYVTDDNRLTAKGLLEMNKVDPSIDDILPSGFRPVLYDKNGTGLYWNENSKHFKPIIARIKLNTKNGYNAELKGSDNPTECIQHLLDELQMKIEGQ